MSRPTQKERVRAYFEAHAGEKIPCYFFAMEMGILQYGRCIKELRDAGMEIENGGGNPHPSHRWFRYTPRAKQQTLFQDVA